MSTYLDQQRKKDPAEIERENVDMAGIRTKTTKSKVSKKAMGRKTKPASNKVTKPTKPKTASEIKNEKTARNTWAKIEKAQKATRDFHAQTRADADEFLNGPQLDLPPPPPQTTPTEDVTRNLRDYWGSRPFLFFEDKFHRRIANGLMEDGKTKWTVAHQAEWPLDLLEKLLDLAKIMYTTSLTHLFPLKLQEIRDHVLAPLHTRCAGSGPNADKKDVPGLIVEDAVVAFEAWRAKHGV